LVRPLARRGMLDYGESTMSAQKEALAKLLRDDDPETVRLVKEQLVRTGEEGLGRLAELCNMDDACVSNHAREVLAEIRGRDLNRDFSLICHFFGERMDLEVACWGLARALQPGCCTLTYEHNLNIWGRELLDRISGACCNLERVKQLSDLMAGKLGFGGNSENYYCEENSLLPRVIESRLGIPISLSALYMMVGSRAAMKIEGINLPGHFIARHGEVFFDPFHGGRILELADVEQILIRQGLRLKECHLQAATPRQILVRMLANLLYVYDLSGDDAKHQRVKSWMDALALGRSEG